ncbi:MULTISPECIES: hypothetical protein [Sorangium]|uniref:Uncharacterized protein n=1 Tax=Sorangium cellulosum TaxID=56 RepID=A0A4P2QLQ5_SORCE|nr:MULTISPECIES: hypothetical protein [Sorangium]AUX30756.1 uncharacterized protein SOCE836_028670 [Sorangium cellulosum]WCQ90135.1 hypothetical protein NQZ70_02836 [Sorangium sp. Soce836]
MFQHALPAPTRRPPYWGLGAHGYAPIPYTLDWGNEVKLLGDCPALLSYMERMYARPNAPPRIAQALASIAAK